MQQQEALHPHVPDENGKRIVLHAIHAIHAIHENEQEISEIQREITDAQARYSRGMITREHFNEIVNENHHELEACIQFHEDYYQLLKDYQKQLENW